MSCPKIFIGQLMSECVMFKLLVEWTIISVKNPCFYAPSYMKSVDPSSLTHLKLWCIDTLITMIRQFYTHIYQRCFKTKEFLKSPRLQKFKNTAETFVSPLQSFTSLWSIITCFSYTQWGSLYLVLLVYAVPEKMGHFAFLKVLFYLSSYFYDGPFLLLLWHYLDLA